MFRSLFLVKNGDRYKIYDTMNKNIEICKRVGQIWKRIKMLNGKRSGAMNI